jgi:hypothetical protein
MWTISCIYALVLPGTLNPSPSWHHDYAQALTHAGAGKRPVAVFIGSGVDGWKTACNEGALSLEVRRLLASHYVCVYVDAGNSAQESVARSFEAGELPLVVLSSHDRANQAYRHSGKSANASLAQALQRHALEDILEVHEEPSEIGTVVARSYEIPPITATCRT